MTSLRQVVARTPIRVVVPLVVLLGLTGLYPAIVQAQVVASDQSWTTLGSFRQDQTRSAKLQRLRVAFNKLGYTDKRFFDKLDPEPSPQSFAVLGKLSDERTLLAQLRIDHPTAELKPDNFMVVAKKATAKRPGLPGVTICAAFTDKRTGEVVGMVLNTYRQTTRGVESHLDYAVLNTASAATTGLIDPFLNNVSKVGQAVGVSSEHLWAWYIGRLAWAQKGYDFKYRRTLFTFRERFGRFLSEHAIPLNSLRLKEENGTLRHVESLSDLKHSWDFAHAISTQGKVTVDILVGEKRVKSREQKLVQKNVTLDVGRAFLLANVKDPVLKQSGAPNWPAHRTLNANSANMRQLSAYREARR